MDDELQVQPVTTVLDRGLQDQFEILDYQINYENDGLYPIKPYLKNILENLDDDLIEYDSVSILINLLNRLFNLYQELLYYILIKSRILPNEDIYINNYTKQILLLINDIENYVNENEEILSSVEVINIYENPMFSSSVNFIDVYYQYIYNKYIILFKGYFNNSAYYSDIVRNYKNSLIPVDSKYSQRFTSSRNLPRMSETFRMPRFYN